MNIYINIRITYFCHCFVIQLSSSPHLLELHANFVKRLRNNGNKYIFYQPSQKKYHCRKIKNRTPRWQAVVRTEHDKNPTFL